MRGLTSALIAFIAFTLSGCFGTVPAYSSFAIEQGEDDALVAHFAPGCGAPVESVTLLDAADDPIWEITADPPVPTDRIKVGETPEGFTETIPHPSALPATHPLTLVVVPADEDLSWQVTFTPGELPPHGTVRPGHGVSEAVPFNEFADAVGCEQQ